MALSGGWKNAQSIQAGASKWGTGINPIHSQHSNSTGRDIAPDGTVTAIDQNVTEPHYSEDGWGYDVDIDDGTKQHPRWGTQTERFRNDADSFPEWGPYEHGVPGGSRIRSENHGAAESNTPLQIPTETVSEGWLNKPTGKAADSRTSDVSTVLVQTSDVQRYKERAGSQSSGRASEYNAGIASRVVGQKVKVYSTGERSYDMQPQQQHTRIRGWWSRTAGTGNAAQMEANSQRERSPFTRQPPPPPNTGPTPGIDNPSDYGYSDEDVIY